MVAMIPLAGDVLGGGTVGGALLDAAFYAFLRNTKQRARFLIEMNAVELDGPIATFSGRDAMGSVPLAHSEGAPQTLGERIFFFGDGRWTGRPGDLLRPNRIADARIISSADIDRSIPLSPDEPRRGEIAVGEITFANSDGGLDALAHDYSISGRSVRIYLGPAHGDFGQFALVQEVFGSHFESDESTLRMRVQSTASLLSTPLQPLRYTGAGGQDGDSDLASRPMPVIYGECSNVTPVLLNRDQWIYQVHDGPIAAIDAVYERGLELTATGTDVASYSALRALDVAAGYWATCNALGLIKIGLGIAGPEGPITIDVRGDAAGSSYSAAMGDILLRVATRRAGLEGSLLDLNSFADLPRGRVGFYADGQEDLTCADVFDRLLASIVGWFTTSRSKLLRVGYATPPEDLDSWAYHFEENQILELEEIGRDQAPRWEQGALYQRNWTPLGEEEISDAVTADERERLAAAGLYIRQVAAEVRIRDRSAISGGDLATYFVSREDAEAVVARIMLNFRQNRRRFRLVTNRVGYLVDLQSKVRVTYPRYGLSAGQNFTIAGVRDDSGRGRVELELWG
jgi:hypothetical protein